MVLSMKTLLILMLVLLAGCGSPEPPSLTPIHGTVMDDPRITYDNDKKMIACAVKVSYLNKEEVYTFAGWVMPYCSVLRKDDPITLTKYKDGEVLWMCQTCLANYQ